MSDFDELFNEITPQNSSIIKEETNKEEVIFSVAQFSNL